MMKKALFWVAIALPNAAAAWPIPMQLELRVPFEPTAFTGAGRAVLMYELLLTNFSDKAIALRRIEVFDADETGGRTLAAFDGEQIDSLLQDPGLRQVNAGATVVVFLQVALDSKTRMPRTLRHRVSGVDSSVEGAVIGTHHTALKLLEPPVRGAGWHAYDGPSNDRENHHRRGLLVLDGHPSISRRFATDWFLKQDGHTYKGDVHDRRSHHSYDQPVYAVAKGTVVSTRDGRPDNVPGYYPDFRPPADLTLDTATGNLIIVDLGGGQFAHYFHLQPGSLRVKPGDRVASGELLARIGTSGDSNVPHLHFEVTTSPKQFLGEGVPYVIDRFRAKTSDGTWQTFTRELPMRNMIVDFVQRGDAH
jgi:murein DD-endopeptidase MepM/ murein hydrolase activator NlpD